MASPPPTSDIDTLPPQDKWGPVPEGVPEHGVGDLDRDLGNGPPHNNGEMLGPIPNHGDEYHRRDSSPVDKSNPIYREKQIKPNKVYIGGLPEHTRQEDLRNCFGKIGEIVNIELKLGYGFVEFTTREAAEESVAKYHEGTFMGNKIRVELSHGGGRTAKYTGDPGACFKCGQLGHWARECPNHVIQLGPGPHRRSGPPPNNFHHHDAPVPPRDYAPPRDYPPYRDEYGRYPPRESRYGYDYPQPGREYRRPPSPPRDYRDYGYPRAKDYDDYRMRPPPPPAPPSRGYYPPDGPPGYPPRGYDMPPRDSFDRGIDRRQTAPPERYAPYPPPSTRPRTPPGPPPRVRDDYDRTQRDYGAPPTEYRGRPTSPPASNRYGDYPPRSGGGGGGGSDQSIGRYRRRSQSPTPRNGGGSYRSGSYVNDQGPEAAPYPSAGASYSSSANTFSGNGYSGGPTGSVPPRSSGSVRDREYTPRSGGADVNVGYSRRA